MANSTSTLVLARTAIVDKNGYPTRDFLKWLQQTTAQTVNLLLDGNIANGAGGSIDPAELALQVQNLDANGIVLPNGVDFSRAYTGKTTANVPAGGTNYYAGEAGADITGNHTAKDTSNVNGVDSTLISPIANLMPAQAGADVTSTHQSATTASLANQTQDALAAGVLYGRTPMGLNTENMIGNSIFTYDSVGEQAAGWMGNGLIVQDTLPNGATGNCLKITTENYAANEESNLFQLTPGQTYLFSGWIRTGGAGSWAIYRGNYGDAAFIFPGAPTAWAYFAGTYAVPANSSQLAGQLIVTNASATSDWAELYGASVVKLRNLDSEVLDGNTRFACLVKALANADGLPAGLVYAIMTAARQNAGLDGSGNLLFKSIETGTITASVSIGAVVALSSVISITTVGKPVKIGGILNCEGGSTGASAVGLQLYRDGSPLAGVAEMGSVWFPQSATDSKPIDYLDNAPSAGPHTYQLFGFNNGGPNALTQGGNFSAWEYA